MSYIEQAIKEAIEKGGYSRYPMPMTMTNRNKTGRGTSDFVTTYTWETICFDPKFWQALGRARGWPEEEDNAAEHFNDAKWHQTTTLNSWFNHWHRFIDHLAEGHDAESFFKGLLSKNI